MNTFQKVIKYAAITFAIILTLGILSGIVGVIATVVAVIDGGNRETIDFSEDFIGVEQLDINSKYGKLVIKPGDQFRVEGTNVSDRFTAKVSNGRLMVDDSDRRFLWFSFGKSINRSSSITIYVPENFNAKRIEINSGVGEVILENLSTDRLIINAGVGEIRGKNILAKSVKAGGGVGGMKFTDVNFQNVDCDGGVGSVQFDGIITGKSKFDCGLGGLEVNIKGSREDYSLDIDFGIGSVRINGDKVSSDYKDNYKSDNRIDIDGGVGEVKINFYD
ncbi:MAG: DUF4097 domain-containing protein [Clostridiales bacterium]|nr:DUF4097 domain-containing protein [Clostridiales bacterium]